MPNPYGSVAIKPEGLAPLPERDKGTGAPAPQAGFAVTNGTESAGRASRFRLNWVIGWRM
jgi:hypothetical protein